MPKTNIKVNSIKKTMQVAVSGKMEKDDAKVFLDQYHAATKSVNASEYTLEVNCKEMKLLNQDMYDELKHVMSLYKSTGFKHVEFELKASETVLKMQLSRLARGAGLTNISFKEVA